MAAIPDTGRNLPWSHPVFRGGNELDAAAAGRPMPSSPPPSSEAAAISFGETSPQRSPSAVEATQIFDGGDGGKSRKPVWNVPENGIVEVSSVMGTSWPALSESTKVSPKSSSDSLKALGDGSGSITPSASQGVVIPSSPQKQNSINADNTNSNPTPNLTGNQMAPMRQKSMKQKGGHSNSGTQEATAATEKQAATGENSSAREVYKKNNNWDGASMGTSGSHQLLSSRNDQGRGGSFRRGNGGGPHHSNYGSRRDQNYEWNSHQNFSGRDIHTRQPRPRSSIRPQPPPPPPFITVPVRHYGGPLPFPDLHSPPLYYVSTPPPEPLPGVVPYVGAPPGMFISSPDPQLRAMLVKQIDYYFSPDNLCKDIFLRQNMDEQGWVPISLIAGFNRVKQLTIYISIILEALHTSTVVEVQGDKIRKRNDWMNWLLPPPNVLGTAVHSPRSPNYDTLATQLQSIELESTANYNVTWGPAESYTERVLTRSSSVEPRNMPHSNWEGVSNRQTSRSSLEKSGSC